MTLSLLEMTQRFPPALGGVEQHVEHLAREMHRAGIRVQVSTSDLARDVPFSRLARTPDAMPFPIRRHHAIRTIPAPHGLGILAPGMLGDALRVEADVIHAHAFGYFPSWAAVTARRLRPASLVVTAHSDEGRGSAGSRLYARTVALATLSRADRVVAQTPREARWLCSLGLDPARLAVIPTPIDLSEFARPPEPAGHPSAAAILFVGRIYLEQKGLDLLVRALARLQTRPPPTLRLVGEDWGGRDRLVELARRLGVRDRLVVTGALSRGKVLEEYSRADLFVLPSRFDSFPVVLLEAMAAHLPIVASNVGGVTDVVADGSTGLVVPPGDVDRLAEAVDRLASDPARRRQMGDAGLRTVGAFSWETLAPRYVAMFEELARRR